jgi:chromosome segregation ATPase
MTRPVLARAVALLFLLLGLGCAELKSVFAPPEPPPPPPKKVEKPEPVVQPHAEPLATTLKRQVSDLEALLAYYDQVRRLSPTEQVKEQDAVRLAFNKDKSDLNRLKLAMLQALPNSAVRNDASAQALIDPLLKESDTRDAGLRAFAQLLNANLAERKKSDDRIRENQQEIEDLQKKLDALKSIEKSLIDRGRPSPPPQPK